MAQYGGYNQSGYGQGGGYNQQAGNPYAQGGNPYAQQQAPSNPYAQQPPNPYAQQQPNPYAQQQANPYAQQHTQQSGNPYAQQGYQNNGYSNGTENIEMGQVNGGAPNQRGDFSILNELKDLGRAIDKTEADRQRMQQLLQLSLDDTDSGQGTQINRQLDQISSQTQAALTSYTRRLNKIKATPGAGDEHNSSQIALTNRRLQDLIQSIIKVKQEAENKARAQIERRVKIVNANATDEEIRAAQEDYNPQIFSDAVMQGNRRGEATAALREVENRSEYIRKIERSIVELADLTTQLNMLIVEQEVKAEEINKKVDDVQTHSGEANKHLGNAVDKARAARRKKWICLGIVVLIILIIVAIIAGYFGSQAAAKKASGGS